jgi:chromate transporter
MNDSALAFAATPPAPTSEPGPGIRFSDAVRVWVRVAALSFGGPAGQIAVMHRRKFTGILAIGK